MFSDVLYVDSRVVTFWQFKAAIRFQGFGRLLLKRYRLGGLFVQKLAILQKVKHINRKNG
jgi:hypothetical protein